MSVAELYRGTFVETILDQLTGAMAIEHKIGALEEARDGAPPRIVWAPPERGGLSVEVSPYSQLGDETIDLQRASFDVEIWASSMGELLALHASIDAQLDILLGPEGGMVAIPEIGQSARPGYEFGQPASVGPVEASGGQAGSVACVVPAVLKSFVARRTFGSAPIVAVPITVKTTDGDGGNAETEIAA